MAMGIGRGRQPEINVTPMIDILLVLIIIFLVVTPSVSKGLRTLTPEPSDGVPNAPSQDIVIEIVHDRSLRINSQQVRSEELGARLVALWKRGARRVIFVKADRDLEFAHVAQVIDIAKGAGYDRIALMP